jgi:hypothetical protein
MEDRESDCDAYDGPMPAGRFSDGPRLKSSKRDDMNPEKMVSMASQQLTDAKNGVPSAHVLRSLQKTNALQTEARVAEAVAGVLFEQHRGNDKRITLSGLTSGAVAMLRLKGYVVLAAPADSDNREKPYPVGKHGGEYIVSWAEEFPVEGEAEKTA